MESLTKYIQRTSRCFAQYIGASLAREGVSSCRVPYIFRIVRNPGLTQEQLAEALFVNKSNVARQLASMEAEGIIYRRRSEQDKRELLVYPTARAEALYPKVRAAIEAWNGMLLDGFADDQREALFSMLTTIMERAEAQASGGGPL